MDRTSELFTLLEKEEEIKSDESTSKLRNRFGKGGLDSDTKSHATENCTRKASSEAEPLLASFNSEAILLGHVAKAEKILADLREKQLPLANDFGQLIELCVLKLVQLQELAENLSKERNSTQGWLSLVQKSNLPKELEQHEAAVIWILNHRISKLTKISEDYRDELAGKAKITKKEREWRQFIPQSTLSIEEDHNRNTSHASSPTVETMETFGEKYNLNQEQLQMLSNENEALLKEYTEMKRQIETTHTSLNEISRLQGILQEQIMYQSTQVDRIFDEANITVDTVRKANVQLSNASKSMSQSTKFFVWVIIVSSLFVLLLHFISD